MSGKNYPTSKESSLIPGRRKDDARSNRDEEYSSADSKSPIKMTNQNVTLEHPCSQEISPTSLGRKRKREIIHEYSMETPDHKKQHGIHEYSMEKPGHKKQLGIHSNMTETQINESNKAESGDSNFVIEPQFEQSQHEPLDLARPKNVAPESLDEDKDYTKEHSSLNILDDALAAPGPSYYTCHICNETFDDQSLLQKHCVFHTPEKSLLGEVCEQTDSVKSSRNSPVLAQSEKVTYKCDQCDRVFIQKGKLKAHYRIHIGKAPYQCDKCGERFSLGSKFGYHRKHCGSSAVKKTIQCDKCHELFSTKSRFTVHYRKHTGEKPQQCKKCNIKFSSPSNLKKHVCKPSSESE